jgi:hypothetical protein
MRIRELTLINNGLLANIDAVGNMQSLRVLRIQGNTKLTGLPALPFVSSLDELRVSDSPQLGALTLGGLQFIKNLEIERNSSLTSIELPQLTTPVQSLIVVSNGSLAADSFRPLMLSAAKAKIGGNQGDPTGLSPCPWRKDGHCDSPPTDTLCAPNTDLADCGYVP